MAQDAVLRANISMAADAGLMVSTISMLTLREAQCVAGHASRRRRLSNETNAHVHASSNV